jgi:NUMOD4 motif
VALLGVRKPADRAQGSPPMTIYDERWLPIPDWEGLYSISNRFRVRTEPRRVERANGAQFTAQGCIRRLDERKSGALMCKLRRPGYEQTIHVGRLVDELFGGDRK